MATERDVGTEEMARDFVPVAMAHAVVVVVVTASVVVDGATAHMPVVEVMARAAVLVFAGTGHGVGIVVKERGVAAEAMERSVFVVVKAVEVGVQQVWRSIAFAAGLEGGRPIVGMVPIVVSASVRALQLVGDAEDRSEDA